MSSAGSPTARGREACREGRDRSDGEPPAARSWTPRPRHRAEAVTTAISPLPEPRASRALGVPRTSIPRDVRRTTAQDRQAQRRILLQAAHSYIEQSPQPPLILVNPVTKRPCISTGRDHAEHASTDPCTIEHWILRRFPDAGSACRPPRRVAWSRSTWTPSTATRRCSLTSNVRCARCRAIGSSVTAQARCISTSHTPATDPVKSAAGDTGPLGNLWPHVRMIEAADRGERAPGSRARRPRAPRPRQRRHHRDRRATPRAGPRSSSRSPRPALAPRGRPPAATASAVARSELHGRADQRRCRRRVPRLG